MRGMVLAVVASGSCLAAASMAQASAPNLLVNGGFEDTTNFVAGPGGAMLLTPGSTDLTGWTITGSGDLLWYKHGNDLGFPAGSGSHFLDLTGTDDQSPFVTISQTVATTVGAKYRFRYQVGVMPDESAGVALDINGSPIGGLTLFGGALGGWGGASQTFTASSNSFTVKFTASTNASFVGLDGASLQLLQAAGGGGGGAGGVPEPATWALMIGGFAATGAALRRRRGVSA